jgi:hypothetical protein
VTPATIASMFTTRPGLLGAQRGGSEIGEALLLER